MALRTDNPKTTGFPCHIVKLDIGTTAGHVGRDGNGSCLAGLSYDFCFDFMELRI